MMTHATSERSKDFPGLGEITVEVLDEKLAAVYRGDPAGVRRDRVG